MKTKCSWCEKKINFKKSPLKISVEKRHYKGTFERIMIEEWLCDTYCAGCYIGKDFRSDREVNPEKYMKFVGNGLFGRERA